MADRRQIINSLAQPRTLHAIGGSISEGAAHDSKTIITKWYHVTVRLLDRTCHVFLSIRISPSEMAIPRMTARTRHSCYHIVGACFLQIMEGFHMLWAKDDKAAVGLQVHHPLEGYTVCSNPSLAMDGGHACVEMSNRRLDIKKSSGDSSAPQLVDFGTLYRYSC